MFNLQMTLRPLPHKTGGFHYFEWTEILEAAKYPHFIRLVWVKQETRGVILNRRQKKMPYRSKAGTGKLRGGMLSFIINPLFKRARFKVLKSYKDPPLGGGLPKRLASQGKAIVFSTKPSSSKELM